MAPGAGAGLADWLAWIEGRHPAGIELGLERVARVARAMRLGRPARRVITVGGTNGKGSTSRFIEAIAAAAGYRVGVYSSPHLLDYNERVRVDGRDSTDARLVEAFQAVERARGDVPLTYFEFGTLAALHVFARSGLDLAVLEVGLGGRLDAVNIVDPDVSVITSVALDHQDWLGADREAIGREKAGIMRGGRPVVLGEVDPPASVLRHAYALGAFAIRAGSDYLVESVPGGWRWREPGFVVDLPAPALDAPVQRFNAAAAIAALRSARLRIPRAAMVEGVAQARLPGRLQRVPRPGGGELVLDVGHNPAAAAELARWLSGCPRRRCVVVLGMLADKDVAGVAAALAPDVDHWWLAGLDAESPRGLSASALGDRLGLPASSGRSQARDVGRALAGALAGTGPEDLVLVTGSFHTVAAALRALQDAAPAAPV
ncbi:MAG: bifunctional tetrahydrofolate synthase/dihydrofolate synthase [Lysobacteraceae bacterium]